MSQKIRIKLKSYDFNLVDKSAEKIVKTVKSALVEEPAGPLPKKGEKVAEKKEKKKNLLGGLLGKKPKN